VSKMSILKSNFNGGFLEEEEEDRERVGKILN